MQFFSQKDPHWASIKLGTCSQNIGQAGCLISSCCNLFPRLIEFSYNPAEFNTYCIKNKLYSNGCMLDLTAVAKKSGLTYKKVTTAPKVTCICETNYFSKLGVPQHFFMWKPDGSIIDPLDLKPDWKVSKYPPVSWRVFTVVQEPIKEVKKPVIVNSSPTEQSTTLNPVEAPNNSTMTPIQEVQAVGGDVDLAIPIQHQEIPKDSYDIYTEKPVGESWIIKLINYLISKLWK